MEREIIVFEYEDISDLWDGVYFENSSVKINGQTYKRIQKINTSERSDGESFDYIVQRLSDKKYFKFNVWECGGSTGYQFSNGKNSLTEVFKKTITTEIFE